MTAILRWILWALLNFWISKNCYLPPNSPCTWCSNAISERFCAFFCHWHIFFRQGYRWDHVYLRQWKRSFLIWYDSECNFILNIYTFGLSHMQTLFHRNVENAFAGRKIASPFCFPFFFYSALFDVDRSLIWWRWKWCETHIAEWK